jgi:hypothetical protein
LPRGQGVHCRQTRQAVARIERAGADRGAERRGSFHLRGHGAPLVDAFVRDITAPEEIAKLEQIREAQKDLLRPVGRPTKRDRRDWERYFK